MNIQRHHIRYDTGWTVELQNFMHRTISIIQRCKPTQERYAMLCNYIHAITFEFNRYREFLDLEDQNSPPGATAPVFQQFLDEFVNDRPRADRQEVLL